MNTYKSAKTTPRLTCKKRSALLGKIRKGIIDWQTTQWDYIKNDTLDFILSYEEARGDIYLKMALIACLSDGLHNLNSEKHKECKAIFKTTEKVYKKHCKNLKPIYWASPNTKNTASYIKNAGRNIAKISLHGKTCSSY